MRQWARGRRPAGRTTDRRDGEAAVSDVIGSFLLVGITVISAAGFGVLLFSFDGPPDALHADVAIRIDPGTVPAWGTGDERVELVHMGGEGLRSGVTTVTLVADGATTTLSGGTLGSVFSDGSMTFGEVWQGPLADLDEDEEVSVLVAHSGDERALVASGVVSGSSSGAVACVTDSLAPSGSWVVLTGGGTNDIDVLTTNPVTFTVTITDACAGVKPGVAPTFYWRFGASGAFATKAMVDLGNDQWTASLRASDVPLWSARLLQTLYWYASPVTDNLDNTGATALEDDEVQAHHTYVNSFDVTAPNVGTVTNFANAQSITASTADVQEVAMGSTPVTLQKRSPASATATNVAGVAVAESNALTSDDVRATLDRQNEQVTVTGFSLPAGGTSVTAVQVGFEGREPSANPTVRVDWRVSAGVWVLGTPFTFSQPSDGDAPAVAINTVGVTSANLGTLEVRVIKTDSSTSRDVYVDHVWAKVTYSTPVYDAQVEFRWTGVPSATTQTVEVAYWVEPSADTFTAQVWQGGSTWRSCTGTLAATTLTTFTCNLNLVPDERQGGAPRMRFLDATAGGTPQGTLHVDWARIVSV